MKKRLLRSLTVIALLSLSGVSFLFAAPAGRPRLAVFAFGNETGNAVYDAACSGAERSLVLTLRQLGTYELESQARSIGRSEEELRAAAMERNADYVMYGGISSGRGKSLVFRLGLFDRAKGKTTVLKESDPVGSLDLFEAIDEVISETLDGITGGHIGFGAIELVNTGEKGTYRVVIDGMDAGDDLTELPRVLAGSHTLSVVQRRMLGDIEVERASVTVREGESREFKFAVPFLTAQEKERLDGTERAIRADWQIPQAAASVEKLAAGYSTMLRDVSYSPRLAEYQARARQLEAEWTIMKNRFEIEERAWNPDSLLLDPSVVVYLTAKSYPDPDALKRGAEANASLLATLHELAAGAAMADGRYEEGLKLLEAILDFSRYLPSERKAEYAFAVATIRQQVSTRGENQEKFKADLKSVFGAQMEAGSKFVSLQDEAKRTGRAVLISSDNGASLSVGSAAPEAGPVLVGSEGGDLPIRVSRGSESSTMNLAVAKGRRVAFLEVGFTAFGRTKAESASAVPLAPLRFKSVPKGYTVFANDEKVGVTPLSQVMVPVGAVDLRFERLGEETKSARVYVELDKGAAFEWGTLYMLPLQLERRTIPLSEDPRAWEGLDPILEGRYRHYSGGLASPEYAITRVFMCRDEKYLYWRIDFAEANPFEKTPKNIGHELIVQLSIRNRGKELNTSIKKSYARNRTTTSQGIWDEVARKWTDKGENVIGYRTGPTTIIQRTLISRMKGYTGEVLPVYIQLANNPDGKGWGPGTLQTPARYVDFTK